MPLFLPCPIPSRPVAAARAARAGALLLATAATAWLPATALAQPYTGASAFGTASGAMVLGCHTCTNYPITLVNADVVGNASAGGQGATAASISQVALIDRAATLASFPDAPETEGPDYTLGGGAAYAATATFSGPLATPLLGARASSDNPRVYLITLLPPDPLLYVGWNYFSASAIASATQGYTFSGTERTTYNVHFSLDGTLLDPRASLSGAAVVHDGDGETGVRAREEATLATTRISGSEALAGSFSIAMTFDPGETLYLEASLSASAGGNFQDGLPDFGPLSADGMHTLRVSQITGGDIGLLTPVLTVSAVPEPASVGMLLLGLGGLAALQRRRSAAASVAGRRAGAA